MKRKEKAEQIINKKPNSKTWAKTHFKTVNTCLKRKGDEKLKDALDGLRLQYEQWRHRQPLEKKLFLGIGVVVNANSDDDNDDDDLPDFSEVHTSSKVI